MTGRKPLPRALQHRSFTVADARALGVPANRLRAADLVSPFRGIRSPRDSATDVATLCRAFAGRMPPGSFFFSHTTAALLWGMPLPRRLQGEPLHVTVAWPMRAPRVSGVIGHATRSRPKVVISAGLPVLSPAEAWRQLSAVLRLDELVEAGDRLLGRPYPLCPADEVTMAMKRYGARRGATTLRSAADWIRERVESPRETRVRLLLVRAGLPEPEINVEIVDSSGRLIAISDLVYRRYKVVVEYEGEHHRTDSVQFARDVDRYNDLADAGWLAIRVTKEMPQNEIIARTRRALLTRGWRP